MDWEKLIARIDGDSAYLSWPDTVVSAAAYLEDWSAALSVRDPVWHRDNEDIAVRGFVLDCDVHPSQYLHDPGTLHVVADTALVSHVAFSVARGDTLDINIPANRWHIPNFSPGDEVVVFLNEDNNYLTLGRSIWSAWTVSGDSVFVGLWDKGPSVPVGRQSWSTFISFAQ
ncbi:MAG: hypothetical protein R3E12_09280 [Candidatus Eisenbacteria bacterium]